MPPRRVSVSYTRRFLRQASRLPADIIDLVEEKERIFRADPFDARLVTHRLRGKEKEVWSFRVDCSHRIKFIFLTKTEPLFLEIGTHEIYD